jgi:tripartite-type tricarboxylate transporter receptor subunit TctC
MKRKGVKIGVAWIMVALFFLIGSSTAFGAEAFPAKPIEMLVAYRAGGLVDTMARALAQRMEETLHQPVVVVNKAGAGGALALTALKNAKNDGYTIGVTTAVSVAFTPLIQGVDYSVQDYHYLASAARFQEAIVSIPEKPWKDFKELVEYSKKNPGLAFASMDPIGTKILEFIAKKEGIQWRSIPTKGGAEVMTAILGKHVDFGFSGGIHNSYCKAGKMIVLAGSGKQRLLASPEVPTLKEFGYDSVFENDLIVLMPKGAPASVVQSLSDATAKAAKHPQYVELLEKKLEIPAAYQGGKELERAMQEFHETMVNLLQFLKD